MATNRTPTGLKAGGRRLWKAVTDEFELADHEQSILLEAVRTVDTLEGLQEILTEEGLMVTSPQGVKVHPAAVELRQQRVVLAKMLASLRLPLEEAEEEGRLPQRRSGVRGLSAVK